MFILNDSARIVSVGSKRTVNGTIAFDAVNVVPGVSVNSEAEKLKGEFDSIECISFVEAVDKLSASDAIRVIERSVEIEPLRSWRKVEKRERVLKAIDGQIAELSRVRN